MRSFIGSTSINVKVSDLNKRIVIQCLGNPKSISNENGFEVENWINYKTVWASVSNLYGREFYAAKVAHAEKAVKFTIRYFKDIDDSMRILFRKKIYKIEFIDNIKYGNKFMVVCAMEELTNG